MQQHLMKLEKGDITRIRERVNQLREALGKRAVSLNHVRLVLIGDRKMTDDIRVVSEIYFEEKAKKPKQDLRAIALKQASERAGA